MGPTGRQSCHDRVRELLAPYALGLLDEAEREAVERHLSACEPCAAAADGYARVVGELEAGLARRAPPRDLLRL
jgi:anti-sigma factor RsiW